MCVCACVSVLVRTYVLQVDTYVCMCVVGLVSACVYVHVYLSPTKTTALSSDECYYVTITVNPLNPFISHHSLLPSHSHSHSHTLTPLPSLLSPSHPHPHPHTSSPSTSPHTPCHCLHAHTSPSPTHPHPITTSTFLTLSRYTDVLLAQSQTSKCSVTRFYSQ